MAGHHCKVITFNILRMLLTLSTLALLFALPSIRGDRGKVRPAEKERERKGERGRERKGERDRERERERENGQNARRGGPQ